MPPSSGNRQKTSIFSHKTNVAYDAHTVFVRATTAVILWYQSVLDDRNDKWNDWWLDMWPGIVQYSQ